MNKGLFSITFSSDSDSESENMRFQEEAASKKHHETHEPIIKIIIPQNIQNQRKDKNQIDTDNEISKNNINTNNETLKQNNIQEKQDQKFSEKILIDNKHIENFLGGSNQEFNNKVVTSSMNSFSPMRKRQLNRPLKTFRCHRISYNLLGKKRIFQLFDGGKLALSGIAKGIRPNSVLVSSDDIFNHEKINPLYTINVKEKMASYALMNHSSEDIYASMDFERVNSTTPRNTHLLINNDDDRCHNSNNSSRNAELCPASPLDLKNKKPIFNEKKGTWQLDFNGRFVIRSNKNAILMEDNGKIHFIVKKTGKNDLEIEAYSTINPMYSIFIGISEWMCRY
ncbi:hypothetical protein TRFO_30866 [Tritrichomonas foetus]|uniref:Tubby C-terminal domain-containing protein n=1 Tax=Tritrichomonas foetus TaxID=1144522 RepID=A0A1J4JSQ6_9EUKA|nr:hypothetical protein TRFO_30866 [Tritrichomonas foetus]|eukprot:OHT02159.1 hypothetical protein TRFO_30866 [Tritrichomonas foetus]